MNKTSLFSGIALATAALGLIVATPVLATGFEQTGAVSTGSQHSTTSGELIAARHCVNKKVYHPPYYTRGIFGRRVYHKAYYSTKRVCY